jgi:hypothetical protein
MSLDKYRLRKYLPPISENELRELERLKNMNLEGFKEDDVREEFLTPIIRLLGYQRDSEYKVLRSEEYNIWKPYLKLGRRKYKLDYQFIVWKQGFWLLEAKPSTPKELKDEDVEQAFSYALLPQVDAPYFSVSNGYETMLYERDESLDKPLIHFYQAEIIDKFEAFRQIVHSEQLTFYIKKRLLARIEQVLSADIELTRTEGFVSEVQRISHRVRPKVLDNFRTVRKSNDTKEGLADTLRGYRPNEIVTNFLNMPSLSLWDLDMASSVVYLRQIKLFEY